MASRTQLQALLESILGSKNVYFQPPPSLIMKYPCIVYFRSNISARFADNLPYNHEKTYTITVIDSDSDSEIPDKIALLARCSFTRSYKSDQLNHDVFSIIF